MDTVCLRLQHILENMKGWNDIEHICQTVCNPGTHHTHGRLRACYSLFFLDSYHKIKVFVLKKKVVTMSPPP